MKLEYQVCSLELARRLRDLKVKQESLFYWIEFANTSYMMVNNIKPAKPKIIPYQYARRVLSNNKYLYSAFTVAELGEMLPDFVETDKGSGYWHSKYLTADKSWHYETEKTEADARAKMLVYLLENKLTYHH